MKTILITCPTTWWCYRTFFHRPLCSGSYNPDVTLDMVVDKYEQYFKDHNRVKEFSGHSLKVHTVAWSADGKRLASGSLDKERLFIGYFKLKT